MSKQLTAAALEKYPNLTLEMWRTKWTDAQMEAAGWLEAAIDSAVSLTVTGAPTKETLERQLDQANGRLKHARLNPAAEVELKAAFAAYNQAYAALAEFKRASRVKKPAASTLPTVGAETVMRTNTRNQYEATLENLVHVFGDLAEKYARFGFDEFRDRVMIAPNGTEEWLPISDTHMIQLREYLGRVVGFAAVGKEIMRDAIELVADRHRFDSAKVWLDGLAWDGVPRAEHFLVTHCGTADDEYTRAVGLYMWTGLAGRVLDPGCQLDMVIALQSKQGTKKSTGLQLLAPHPDYFTDGLTLHQDDDNFKRLLRGKVIIEIAELAGLSKADINVVKRVITRRTEEWIEKYRVQPTTFKRRCMLFASTNDERFLPPDETGQRRWLPVEITELDRASITADRNQLWAEGAALWRERGVLYAEAERLAIGRHKKHEQSDVWESKIEQWLLSPREFAGKSAPPPALQPFTIAEVLHGALLMTDERMDARAEKRAARVLRALGYESRDVRVNGRALKRWVAKPIQ